MHWIVSTESLCLNNHSAITATLHCTACTRRCLVIGNGDDDIDYVQPIGDTLADADSCDYILARGAFTLLSSPTEVRVCTTVADVVAFCHTTCNKCNCLTRRWWLGSQVVCSMCSRATPGLLLQLILLKCMLRKHSFD